MTSVISIMAGSCWSMVLPFIRAKRFRRSRTDSRLRLVSGDPLDEHSKLSPLSVLMPLFSL